MCACVAPCHVLVDLIHVFSDALSRQRARWPERGSPHGQRPSRAATLPESPSGTLSSDANFSEPTVRRRLCQLRHKAFPSSGKHF